MKQRIIPALTATLGLFLLTPDVFATNTPNGDCVGTNACKTNSDNVTMQPHANGGSATANGGQQQQQQGQTANGGQGVGTVSVAPQTSLSTGGYVYNNRTLSIRPVQAIAPAVVAPSAEVSRMVDPTCGPRQVVVAEDVHGRIIGVFHDSYQTIGEDHYLKPAETAYRLVEVLPGLTQLIGHRVHETTAVVTTSTSGALAFGANGASGRGGSVGGSYGGALQRMVTTIRLQECVAYEVTAAPKPAPVKRRPAKRKQCDVCKRNSAHATAQAAAQQAVNVTVNIAKDQPAK